MIVAEALSGPSPPVPLAPKVMVLARAMGAERRNAQADTAAAVQMDFFAGSFISKEIDLSIPFFQLSAGINPAT